MNARKYLDAAGEIYREALKESLLKNNPSGSF